MSEPDRSPTSPASARRLPISLEAHYLETPVARRLRAILDEAREERVGYVVGALSGAGKTTEIAEYQDCNPTVRWPDGRTFAPVVRGAPAIDQRSSVKAFTRSFIDDLGTAPRGTQDAYRSWLAGQLVACRTELLVVDDGHGANAEDLLFFKQLIDDVEHKRRERIGFVFLCAATQGAMPLQEIVNRPTLQWVQFRGRMSPTRPWCYIASLSEEEISEVLAGWEHHVLAEHFPALDLVRWSGRIHHHLVHPFFDLEGSQRVTMKQLRILVTLVLHRLVAAGLADIPDDGAIIDAAVAELLDAPATKVIVDDPVVISDAATRRARRAPVSSR
jgi:hypothetical protein